MDINAVAVFVRVVQAGGFIEVAQHELKPWFIS